MMYKDTLVEWLKSSRRLVFSSKEASKQLGIAGPLLTSVLNSLEKRGTVSRIAKGIYYFSNAPVHDVYAVASKIVCPAYIATESAFERYGISDIIPKDIRVIATRQHRGIEFSGVAVKFIKFKKQNFFGYNESRWISISTIEKAFVDSLYIGEFPFFSDIANYYRKMVSFGRDLDYKRLVEYTLRMDSKVLPNKVGFFLDYVGRSDAASMLLRRIYKKKAVRIDRSGASYKSKKWMIA
ncbi:MAG: hypothetical protein M1360_00775 [Candidatus Marsarchaeota archaeon]|jgi:predicted transcriptional regulator of viral defense system|nr:hypothetical protein [Candidatus Marsarchaeota archaeon]MCL5418460.1 hypothetical protein [Candidatus Marsarchaeota archaeon]